MTTGDYMRSHRTLTILTLLLLTVGVVAAQDAPAPIPHHNASISPQPTEPHQFFGSLTINGQPAPNNMLVEAYVGAGPALPGSSPAGISATRNGGYGYSPYIMMVVPRSTDNTIFFYLVGDDGERHELGTHSYEKFGITQLDFSISCPNCLPPVSPPSTGSSGSTTGSGGGGGGSGGFTGGSGSATDVDGDETEGTADVCVPDWRCSEWTACSDNVRHRVCVDRNDCGVEDDMPEIRESCGVVETEPVAAAPEEEPAQGNFLTGLATGAGGLGALFFLVALGLLVAALVWKSRR